MQKIIDNLGITVSSVCAIHCLLLPAIFLIAPYSFLASHEFHEALIYFILPCALIAFVLGCRKHGDMKVAIMGSIGIILLASAVILQAGTPTAISTILMAEAYDVKQKIASKILFTTTLISIVTIPLLKILLNTFN